VAAGAFLCAAVPAGALVGAAPPACATSATVAALAAPSRGLLAAEIIRSDGSVEPARQGSKLCDLDRLRTGFRTHATLNVLGQAAVDVAELSSVYVAGLQLDPRRELTLWLRAGEISVTPSTPLASPLQLRLVTPTATVTATASRIRLVYDQISPRGTRIAVRRGAALVTPSSGPFRQPRPNGLRRVALQAGREVVVGETAVGRVAAIDRAGVPPGWVTRETARAVVEGILLRNSGRCQLSVGAIKLRPGAQGWVVAGKLTAGGRTGWAVWNFVGKEIRHTNPLATFAGRGCP
jgi:hypothetical protein